MVWVVKSQMVGAKISHRCTFEAPFSDASKVLTQKLFSSKLLGA